MTLQKLTETLSVHFGRTSAWTQVQPLRLRIGCPQRHASAHFPRGLPALRDTPIVKQAVPVILLLGRCVGVMAASEENLQD